jgi:2-hydroxycyclohexanecarboxyl-CoA dehydrogenase
VPLDSKIAIVTGAASGIGEGIARRLAADGARVAVCDVDETQGEAVAAQIGGIFVGMDVTSTAAVEGGVERITADLGPVDVLVNCAGADVVKPFLETDEELWRWLVELNYLGVLRTSKAVLSRMVERGAGGRLINIASDAGRIGSSGEAAYSGAKGGVIAFTKTIAREHARQGITANTVCPGPTETPPLLKTVAEGGERFIEALKKSIPLRRLGKPADVAATVAFLAADDAGFITGQTVSVSGGLSMV